MTVSKKEIQKVKLFLSSEEAGEKIKKANKRAKKIIKNLQKSRGVPNKIFCLHTTI